jgi:hypothetical protein
MNNKKGWVQAFLQLWYHCTSLLTTIPCVWCFSHEVVLQECSNFKGEEFFFLWFCEFLINNLIFFTWDALVGMFKGNLLDGF